MLLAAPRSLLCYYCAHRAAAAAIFQVVLDREYPDVVEVDLWVTSESGWAALYSNMLTIYLSPTDQYLCGAACAVVCASSFNASAVSPAVNRAMCQQSLNNTRYVTLHKPLGVPTAGSDRIHIMEMRIVRAGEKELPRPLVVQCVGAHMSACRSRSTDSRSTDSSFNLCLLRCLQTCPKHKLEVAQSVQRWAKSLSGLAL